MHITPDPPSMTIARVRELANQMAGATTPVVCSFTRDQLIDLLAEIDMRAPAPSRQAAPVTIREVSPVTQYAEHRSSCNFCRSGDRCDAGKQLYAAACVALMDQTRMVL